MCFVPFPAGGSPRSVTVDPSGRFAYAAHFGLHQVSAFTIDSRSGALAAVTGSPVVRAGDGARSVTVDARGRFAYVANQLGSGSVSAFTINGATGALTAAGTFVGVPPATTPFSIVTTSALQ